MKKELLANLATGVLALCALVITGLVARRELLGTSTSPAPQRLEEVVVPRWQEYAAEGRREGPADAPVVMVVFSDFQCPACAALAASTDTLRSRLPDALAVVYRHFPLPNHSHAVEAARASDCAADQGRFGTFHDRLFAGQAAIGTRHWRDFAAEAGVGDLAAFDQCLAGAAPDAALQRDTIAARRLGVEVTPTVLINGRRINGAPTTAMLEQLVRDATPRGTRHVAPR